MKKNYISPAMEQTILFAEEAVMLQMSGNKQTEEIWTQEKHHGGWDSDSWNNAGCDTEE